MRADPLERTALLSILVAATALRMWALSAESLWLDEIATVHFVSTHSLAHVVRDTFRIDYHPFAYYALLKLWTLVAGTSDAACRTLSALLGTAGVAVAYALARMTTGRATSSLLVAAVVAVLPTAVWYSQECRMYALLVLAWPVCLLALLRFVTDGFRLRHALLFLAAFTTFAYAHGSAGFVSLPFVVGAALVAGGGPRRGLGRRLALGIAAALLYLPWAVRLARLEAGGKSLYRLGPLEGRRLIEWLFVHDQPLSPMGVGLVWLAVSIAAAGLLIARNREPAGRHLGFVAASVIVPVLVTALVSWFVPFHQVRNLIFVLVPLVLLVGHGLAALVRISWASRRRASRVSAGILGAGIAAAISFLSSMTLHDFRTTPQKEDWRGLARYIDANSGPGDVIAFYAGFTEPSYEHYAQPRRDGERRLIRVGRGGFPASADTLLSAIARGSGRTWVVYSHVGDVVTLETLIEGQGLTPRTSADFHDILIRSYE